MQANSTLDVPEFPSRLVVIQEVEANAEYSFRQKASRKAKIPGNAKPDATLALLQGVSHDSKLALDFHNKSVEENEPNLTLADIVRNGHLVKFLTGIKRTEQICIAAVKEDQFVFLHLTRNEQTQKVCLAAVKAFGQCVAFMDDEQRTPVVCLEAMKKNGLSIRHLKTHQRTPEVCEAAARSYGRSIRHMTDEQKTATVCELAAAQCGLALKYMTTPEQRAPKAIVNALRQNINALNLLTSKDLSLDVCQAIKHLDPQQEHFADIVARAKLIIQMTDLRNEVNNIPISSKLLTSGLILAAPASLYSQFTRKITPGLTIDSLEGPVARTIHSLAVPAALGAETADRLGRKPATDKDVEASPFIQSLITNTKKSAKSRPT